MTEIIIKWKHPETGKWSEIDHKELIGQSLYTALYAFADRQVVVEVTVDGAKCYFCGTQEWVDHFKSKGDSAVLIRKGADHLLCKYPKLANEVFVTEAVAAAAAIFGVEGITSIMDA